jgi:hypothetical protein
MVKREELSMFVEEYLPPFINQINFRATLHTGLGNFPINTPTAEYPIGLQVMQGVVVPNMDFEVCLCSLVVCPNPFLPSTDQIINQRVHVHIHIILQVFKNYQ